jgi:hypothetical protein
VAGEQAVVSVSRRIVGNPEVGTLTQTQAYRFDQPP